jgi:hypothetical protein
MRLSFSPRTVLLGHTCRNTARGVPPIAAGTPEQLLALLKYVHDARFPLSGASPAFDAGAAAVARAGAGSGGGKLALGVDLHSWHTQALAIHKKK